MWCMSKYVCFSQYTHTSCHISHCMSWHDQITTHARLQHITSHVISQHHLAWYTCLTINIVDARNVCDGMDNDIDIALVNITLCISLHYSDLIMSTMASQITGVSIVYSTVCSGTDKRKRQKSASLAFVRGIHRWPVNSPHKGPVTRKTFHFDDVIMQTFNQDIDNRTPALWDILNVDENSLLTRWSLGYVTSKTYIRTYFTDKGNTTSPWHCLSVECHKTSLIPSHNWLR